MKNAHERKQAVLEALSRLMPPEAYAQGIVELTQAKDKRVRARGYELIAKLQGSIEEEGASHQVVVRFSSVLTGARVGKHQGLSGRQSEAKPDELGSG